MEEFITSVFDVAKVAVKVFLEFWKQLVRWAKNALELMQESLDPIIYQLGIEALVIIDKVKAPATKLIKKAWKTFRHYLAKSLVTFTGELLPDGKYLWIKKWVTSIYKIVENKPPKKVTYTYEEEINWEDLPEELRIKHMKNKAKEFEFDFKSDRDKQMEMIS